MIYSTRTPSPLGEILLAARDQALVGVWFSQQQKYLPPQQGWRWQSEHPVLQMAAQQLNAYFAQGLQVFDVPLDVLRGTPFQRKVWRALTHIPYGQTRTYGEIARDIGQPSAHRAVGAAIGQNPHSIMVPCHRVVGANGSLTGFAGGLDRKIRLLAHENPSFDRH